MIFYTSDLHFGHANVIGFDNRPFANIDEMDQYIISQWNERVSSDDTVYILGDVCYRNSKDASWYLRRLKGHKILVWRKQKGLNSCEPLVARLRISSYV